MKVSGRNIKRRLYKVSRLRDRISRARHFRGHGVHSPFVYNIVRQVFMCSYIKSDKHDLYDALVERGVPKKRAVQLQNLAVHCGYVRWAIDDATAECELLIATDDVVSENLAEFIECSARSGATLAILAPYKNRGRDEACRRIVANHGCTTVDNRGYLLIFNNHLPKQHFRL